MTESTESEGRLIKFEPRKHDIVSTRLRTWTCKHPGTLAYYQLINEHVHKLPSSSANNKKHSEKLTELANQIYEITTIERRGRFLKLDDKKLGDATNNNNAKPTYCTLLNREASIQKIKYSLTKKQKKLNSNGGGGGGGGSSTHHKKNVGTTSATATTTTTMTKTKTAAKTYEEQFCQEVANLNANNSSSSNNKGTRRSTTRSIATTTTATTESSTTTTTADTAAIVSDANTTTTTTTTTAAADLITYPSYVYNKRKAIREIEDFVTGLVTSKQCSCNYSWCYLWRPHYLFAFNPDMKHHLINAIISFHSQENRNLSHSSSQVSQWFVKANKYRLVLTLDGDCTIHLCRNGLCRIFGLTTSREQNDFDRDQRILVYMKKQQQQSKSQSQNDDSSNNNDNDNNNDNSMEENYKEFIASERNDTTTSLVGEGSGSAEEEQQQQPVVDDSDGSSSSSNLVTRTTTVGTVSFDYFRTFWEVNLPNVLAGLWVDQNSRQSLMDNFTSTDTFEGNYNKRKRGPSLRKQQQQQQQTTTTTATASSSKNTASQKKKQKQQKQEEQEVDEEEDNEEEMEGNIPKMTTTTLSLSSSSTTGLKQQQQHRASGDYQHWMSKYRAVEAFHQENRKPPTKKTNRVLYKWIKSQKQAIRRSPTSPQQSWKIDLFQKVGIYLIDVDTTTTTTTRPQQQQQFEDDDDDEEEERTATPSQQQQQHHSNNEERSTTTTSSSTSCAGEEGRMQKYEEIWTEKWELVKEFMKENDGVRPTAKSNNQLYIWLTNQRSDYKRSPSKNQSFWKRRRAKLAELGIDVTVTFTEEQQQQQQQQERQLEESSGDEKWMRKWELLKEFMKENDGDRPTAKTNNQLYMWVMNCRSDYRRSPSKDQTIWKGRVAKLAELGIDVTVTYTEEQQHQHQQQQQQLQRQKQQQQQESSGDERWMQKWELLKEFMEDNDGDRPTAKTNNQLYMWLMNCRADYKKSPKKDQIIWIRRAAKMAELGIDVTITFTEEQQQQQQQQGQSSDDGKWLQKWELLKEFMEQNSGVRPTAKTNNQLYIWLMSQRSDYKKSNKKDQLIWIRRLGKLAELGIDVTVTFTEEQQHQQQQQQQPSDDEKWMKKWELLKEFMEQNSGDRPTAKTNNQLYTWLMNQRSDYRRSPRKDQVVWKRRVAKLVELGIDITMTFTEQQQQQHNHHRQQQPEEQEQEFSGEEKWIQKWEALKEYMEQNSGDRPTGKANYQLYTWLMNQRSDYKRSPSKDQSYWKRRVAKMAELGIDITISAAEEQQQQQKQNNDDEEKWTAQPASKRARLGGSGSSSGAMGAHCSTKPSALGGAAVARASKTTMFGTQNKTARRISMDAAAAAVVPPTMTLPKKTPTHWRCTNCFHSNSNKETVEMLHPDRQRPSVASLNRKYKIQKRKARFIRRDAFHPASKLSQL